MKIGIVGVGVVGGALKTWFENKTKHTLALYDPPKGLTEDLSKSDAIFICIPVSASDTGQDQTHLEAVVNIAKRYSDNVFIRSTVLPGTNDKLGTTSCPEFLTARFADMDMDARPILSGPTKDKTLIERIFPGKEIIRANNVDCEMAKYTHNCFGALKVTYFNIIYELCRIHGADYKKVLDAAMVTGFLGPYQHTHVPGPDGKRGYGGACFPDNIKSFKAFSERAAPFFEQIEKLNHMFRSLG